MPSRPPLHWIHPDGFQVNLYRAGWRDDRTFRRIVAEIGGGSYEPISSDDISFVIKANTINKVRERDVAALLLLSATGNKRIGLDTKLDGIRVTGPNTKVGGISLFDHYRTAPITSNSWYVIPPEIGIPHGLTLVKANHPSAAGATHYTLGPAEPMALSLTGFTRGSFASGVSSLMNSSGTTVT